MSTEIALQANNSLSNYLEPTKFEHVCRIAKVFAGSDLVPKHFQGRVDNCFIALQMAFRLEIDPMLALQNMYIVYGNPGLSSQLAIALANKSGVFSTQIWFEETGTGAGLSVTAHATLAKANKSVSQTVSLAQAENAGWTKSKDGVKPFWKAMPSQMLRYRSAVYLIRAYCPDVILGMHTKEEWEDMGDNVQAPKSALNTIVEQAKLQENTKPVAPVEQKPQRGRPRKETEATQQQVDIPLDVAYNNQKTERPAPVVQQEQPQQQLSEDDEVGV